MSLRAVELARLMLWFSIVPAWYAQAAPPSASEMHKSIESVKHYKMRSMRISKVAVCALSVDTSIVTTPVARRTKDSSKTTA
jgi:hypothetical protein